MNILSTWVFPIPVLEILMPSPLRLKNKFHRSYTHLAVTLNDVMSLE
jgi:hypothetical protein